MYSRTHFSHLSLCLCLTLALLFSGCSSSSDSDSNPDDDPNPSPVSFSSGNVSPDGTFSYTFETEAEVEYYCTVHAPDMQGQITVTSSAEAVARDTVRMEGMEFVPAQLDVAPGTEVIWINESDLDHTVTSGNPSSGSGDGPDY